MGPLTRKRHEAYARERAAGKTCQDAWEAAGFRSCSRNYSRLEKRPEIRARIEEMEAEAAKLSGVNLAHVQSRLMRVVNADPAALLELDNDGNLKPRAGLPDRAAISKVKIEGDSVTVESVSAGERTAAAALILRTIPGAMAVRQIELAGKDGAPLEDRSPLEVATRIAFLLQRARPEIEGEVLPASPGARAKQVARDALDCAKALRGDSEASAQLAAMLDEIAGAIRADATTAARVSSPPLVPDAGERPAARVEPHREDEPSSADFEPTDTMNTRVQ